tara:strand:- start:85 stop:585 length:501 start_codon:yes stop_codon:yes gene_type:complete
MLNIKYFCTLIVVYANNNRNSCLCRKTIYTPKLLDQYNEPVNWNKYNIIAIGNKKDHKLNNDLLTYVLTKFKLFNNDICIIASIPSWFSTYGSKILLRNSIKFIESKNPVYIDWHQSFANANNVTSFPTIIIKTKMNNLEVSRISGFLTKDKLEHFFNKLKFEFIN